MSMDNSDKAGLLATIVVILIGAMLIYVALPSGEGWYETKTYEVYSVKCPDGVFWERQYGGFLWHDTELSLTYVVQYVDNGVLKTMMFDYDARNLRVLVGEAVPMFSITYAHYQTGLGTYTETCEYTIGIPAK
jgi:hypothetical protein